jgi:hypothetical protein
MPILSEPYSVNQTYESLSKAKLIGDEPEGKLYSVNTAALELEKDKKRSRRISEKAIKACLRFVFKSSFLESKASIKVAKRIKVNGIKDCFKRFAKYKIGVKAAEAKIINEDLFVKKVLFKVIIFRFHAFF